MRATAESACAKTEYTIELLASLWLASNGEVVQSGQKVNEQDDEFPCVHEKSNQKEEDILFVREDLQERLDATVLQLFNLGNSCTVISVLL